MIPRTWQKLARTRLPRQVRDTYFALAHHCFGNKRHCCPSQRRLAHMIDAAPSTVHEHIDKLSAWHVITRHHRGRHCEYDLHDPAEWRVPQPRRRTSTRHKSRKSADCSETRTEKRTTFGVSLRQRAASQKHDVSERRAKRQNLITGLKRWAAVSPHLPDDERPHRLALLDRAAAMLDDWRGRPAEDQRAFELLVARARAAPLAGAVVQSLQQQPLGPRSLAAFLPVLGYRPANPAASPLGVGNASRRRG
jgi:hypothetical protein